MKRFWGIVLFSLERIFEDFTRDKFYSLLFRDMDYVSGFRISSFPSLTCVDFKTSKSGEGHSFSLVQGSFNSFDQ